jgi:hypothetical protein
MGVRGRREVPERQPVAEVVEDAERAVRSGDEQNADQREARRQEAQVEDHEPLGARPSHRRGILFISAQAGRPPAAT